MLKIAFLQLLSFSDNHTDRKVRAFERVDKQTKGFSGMLCSVFWPENNPRYNPTER